MSHISPKQSQPKGNTPPEDLDLNLEWADCNSSFVCNQPLSKQHHGKKKALLSLEGVFEQTQLSKGGINPSSAEAGCPLASKLHWFFFSFKLN